jgi:hypothetical protein
MTVSMNGLRTQLIRNYNSLTYKLNNRIDEDGNILVDVDDIQREMDQLRSCLVALAFSYIKGEEEFTCMSDDTHFESFNYNDEDEN